MPIAGLVCWPAHLQGVMKLVRRTKFDCALFFWIYLYMIGARAPPPSRDYAVLATVTLITTLTASHHRRRHMASNDSEGDEVGLCEVTDQVA